MTSAVDISALLPHAGSARMLEQVLEWDDQTIHAQTTTHLSADNPLRRDGRLAAVHLVEYGAQAMAIHGALRSRAAGMPFRPALLVAVRSLSLSRDYIDDLSQALRIRATAQLSTASSWVYEFEVRHAGEIIATGRVAAMA